MNEINCLTDDKYDHSRTIVHIDVDCFYAQVEMVKDPSLRFKPLGIQQKNLLVTCNYVAREFGLKKCMPLKEAMTLCPSLVVVNGEDLYHYRKISYQITTHLQQYSTATERLGLDENFIDVTNMVKERLCSSNAIKLVGHIFNNAEELCNCGCEFRLKVGSAIAEELRNGIKNQFGLTCCAGIAHNKLLAKLAGGLNKPNQQTTVYPKSALDLVSMFDLSKIPGIGVSTIDVLNGLNLRCLTDLQNCDYKTLATAFTQEKAKQLIDLCFGRDASEVKPSGKPQSIGLEDSCKSVSVETEIEDKFTHLLKRLLILVAEDGRIPTTIKITVRKLDSIKGSGYRQTRQCNINCNLFAVDQTTNTVILKEKSEKKLLSIVMNMFHKLLCNTKSFRITLLGLSFTKFQERCVGKNSVVSFLTKDLAVQAVTNIENNSVPEPTTSKTVHILPEPNETEIEPSAKKFRCNSHLLESNSGGGFGNESEYSSPSKLRVADLRLNSRDSDDGSVNCPPNACEEVFRELPTDMQRELWENWKRERNRQDMVPNKKTKTNTILNYFVKNF